MKKEVFEKLEIFTNLAIIAVAALLGFFLLQKFFFGENVQSNPPEIAKGTKVSVADLSWPQDRKTLLLVLQKDCRFCSESMPFYKTLTERSKAKGIQLVAVLPDSREEGLQYLKENGLDVQEVRQVRSSELNVRGTPTLILLNEQGEVVNSWMGKLPSEKEKEVMDNL